MADHEESKSTPQLTDMKENNRKFDEQVAENKRKHQEKKIGYERQLRSEISEHPFQKLQPTASKERLDEIARTSIIERGIKPERFKEIFDESKPRHVPAWDHKVTANILYSKAALDASWDNYSSAEITRVEAKRVERLAESGELAVARAVGTGKQEKQLRPGMTTSGRLTTKLEAPSGNQYGVIETEKEFSLVPWRERFRRNLGRKISLGMDQGGQAFVKSLAKELSR